MLQLQQYEESAAALATYLSLEPEDEKMQQKLTEYKLLPEMKEEYFVSLLRPKHEVKHRNKYYIRYH